VPGSAILAAALQGSRITFVFCDDEISIHDRLYMVPLSLENGVDRIAWECLDHDGQIKPSRLREAQSPRR
jgi:hypothetical protein